MLKENINTEIDLEDAPEPLTHTGETIEAGKRILVKKGREYIVFRMEDIAYFYIDNGISYMIEGKSNYKYKLAKPLRNIELIDNPQYFFRASKKYLVNINAVVKFRPAKKGKLELQINPDPNETIIISQLKAQLFKKWLMKN